MRQIAIMAGAFTLFVIVGLWAEGSERGHEHTHVCASASASAQRSAASPTGGTSPVERLCVSERDRVALSAPERRPNESDIVHESRLRFLDSYRRFEAEAQLTEAQEQAVLRAMADAQINYRRADEDSFRLLLEASPVNPEGQAHWDEYMASRGMVAVLDTITQELETELGNVLDERQHELFDAHFHGVKSAVFFLGNVAPLELVGPRQLTSIR